jgi:predicted nucleic acid-binding protein
VTYLLDTNVVSEVRRPRPHPGVFEWWNDVPARRLYVSSLTIGELRRGVGRLEARDDHAQARRLADWLDDLTRQFADRILAVDTATADLWGRLPQQRPIPVVDGLIAATALRHDLTLVTRNVRDFSRTGVTVLDPFGG